MSVYRDTNSVVVFEHPFEGPLDASVYNGGADPILTVTGLTPTAGQYTLNLTYGETQFDGNLNVVWSGTNFTRTQVVEVVTPVVSTSRLRTLYTDQAQTVTDSELADLEATVRAIIQTYTGQRFGYSVGSRNYIGNGSGKLILNERCNNLEGILGVYGGWPSDYVQTTDPVTGLTTNITNLNGELNLERAGLIQDGWAILINFPEYLDVRQSPPMETLNFAPSQDGTIRVPRRIWSRYDKGTPYTLYGEWGYSSVPEPVSEAAMLLANDYITNDSGYRDRYLEILKIQQDSFTYHPGAFRGTGNARVDLLLGPYRRQNGMIIL
jgi:hypothetical protein